ncbi:hypothetical protein [Lentzea sp. NPDC092896]|uniref:hypothetical protein n=1 Tax=Lentzea sp. NPDC092896 TaxID=3364127 RepID=UPI0037F7B17F
MRLIRTRLRSRRHSTHYAHNVSLQLRNIQYPGLPIARAFTLAAENDIRGLVAFSDPMERWPVSADGRPERFMPGHYGYVYRALNFAYLGTTTPRQIIVLPDGEQVLERSLSKLTGGERAADSVIARLMAKGARHLRTVVTARCGWRPHCEPAEPEGCGTLASTSTRSGSGAPEPSAPTPCSPARRYGRSQAACPARHLRAARGAVVSTSRRCVVLTLGTHAPLRMRVLNELANLRQEYGGLTTRPLMLPRVNEMQQISCHFRRPRTPSRCFDFTARLGCVVGGHQTQDLACDAQNAFIDAISWSTRVELAEFDADLVCGDLGQAGRKHSRSERGSAPQYGGGMAVHRPGPVCTEPACP